MGRLPLNNVALFNPLLTSHRASLVAQTVKNLPPIQETWVWSLVWSCCPRDSQESSPAPQLESIISSVLSLLYGPTVTSIYDDWKNHSFDYMDLCQQSKVSVSHTVYICHSFSSKKQASFNFVGAVTIYSDLGAQEKKICYCFHLSPFYLPWYDGTRCHDLRESCSIKSILFYSPPLG